MSDQLFLPNHYPVTCPQFKVMLDSSETSETILNVFPLNLRSILSISHFSPYRNFVDRKRLTPLYISTYHGFPALSWGARFLHAVVSETDDFVV
jgi:hypothetical protein